MKRCPLLFRYFDLDLSEKDGYGDFDERFRSMADSYARTSEMNSFRVPLLDKRVIKLCQTVHK